MSEEKERGEHMKSLRLGNLFVGSVVALVVMMIAGPNLATAAFVDDGKVVFGVYTDIVTMDPHEAFVWYSCTITRNSHEGLLQYDIRDFSIKPALAESYTVDENGGTFKLRKGVKFHDGTEFKADAVKFNLERIKALNKGPATWVKDIKEVKIIDDYTVRLETTKNWAFFLDVLAAPWCFMMTSPAAIKKNASTDDPWASKWAHDHTCGTGPYMATEWVPNQHIKMVRFADYWRGWEGKHFSEVVYQVIKEESTLRMVLTKGEVDLINQISVEFWPILDADPKVTAFGYPSLAEQFILMNNARGPLVDKNLRWAVTWAIDYDACRAVANASPEGLIIGKPIKRDINKAKEFKAKSAYAGKEVTLKFAYLSAVENHRKWALIIQDNLKEIGIKLELEAMTWPVFAKQLYGPKAEALDLYPFYASSIVADPYGVLYKVLHSNSIAQGGANLGYKDAKFDALLDEAASTMDRQKRMAIYEKARVLPEEDAAYLWLFMLPYFVGHRDDVKPYSYTKFGDPLGNMFYFYDYYREKK
jgi:peptide/nickel transport system substrate-binding protein